MDAPWRVLIAVVYLGFAAGWFARFFLLPRRPPAAVLDKDKGVRRTPLFSLYSFPRRSNNGRTTKGTTPHDGARAVNR